MARLEVSGNGSAVTDPDYAALGFHASGVAPSSAEAMTMAKERASAIIDVLDAAGIDSKDRGAQHSSVHRRTRWRDDREHFEGWEAQITVNCTVREPVLAYELVEGVTQIAEVSVNGPRWVIDGANSAHDLAREAAVQAARQKAQSYASACGLDLGALLEIIEGSGGGGGPRMMRMAAAESDTTVDPAAQTVNAVVTLVFEAT